MLLLSVAACKRDEIDPAATANINVINVAVDAGAVKVATANESFIWRPLPSLNYSASTSIGAYPGTNSIQVVSATDTTKMLYSATAELKMVNTLYLTGQSPNIEGVFVAEDNVPFGIAGITANAENVMYIRFVNLCPNAGPINVKISNASGDEVSSLAYKGFTDFKKYVAAQATTSPAVPQTPDYLFQFRDVATNTLLASATVGVTTNRYRTLSLILKGLKGATGTNAPGILQVNYHYDRP